MKIHCLGDETTIRGFRLAGIAGTVVRSPAEAVAGLELALARPECGILLLTEDVARELEKPLAAVRGERLRPLIVIVPGASGPASGESQLRKLARAAVGVRID